MTYILTDINEAVDRKYLVTSKMNNQAEVGTVIHIMGMNDSGGEITANYRVTTTGQDFSATFKTVKDFCKWARPDDFIARYHESFSKDEIKHYIKVNSRTFVNFCLPILVVALAIIWVLAILVIKETTGIIVGAVATVIAVIVTLVVYRKTKFNMKMKLYRKVSTKWGVSF